MIHRSFDAADINPILNHPSVMRMIARPGIEKIDIAPVIADLRNVLLMTDGGGFIFAQQEAGIYEVHTNFLEGKRGAHAIHAAREACKWMFLHTDAMILQTRVPSFNRAAEGLARLVGGQMEFVRKNAWETLDGICDVAFWTLRYENWVYRQKAFLKAGEWFHRRLDEEFARLGRSADNHADDEAHDLYVGACVEMIRSGQPEKAIVLYNRIALFAGFGRIALLSRAPVQLDIGTAIVEVAGDDFRVLKLAPE